MKVLVTGAMGFIGRVFCEIDDTEQLRGPFSYSREEEFTETIQWFKRGAN
jgi:hypothetical protein